MKAGTRIEVQGWDLSLNETWQGAKIVRTTKAMLPMPSGWHPILFDDGEVPLLCHESRFRVVDNRAFLASVAT